MGKCFFKYLNQIFHWVRRQKYLKMFWDNLLILDLVWLDNIKLHLDLRISVWIFLSITWIWGNLQTCKLAPPWQTKICNFLIIRFAMLFHWFIGFWFLIDRRNNLCICNKTRHSFIYLHIGDVQISPNPSHAEKNSNTDAQV